VREHADELARLNEAETGRPREEAIEGVHAGAGTLDQYAELGPLHRGKSLQGDVAATDFMIPQPRGVVAVLTPWNDPVAVSCGLLGAALVTGNSVVYKPSERAPHTGALLGKILAEAHPPDVVRTVTGDGSLGAMLTGDPRLAVVAHVGSTATGRAIREATAHGCQGCAGERRQRSVADRSRRGPGLGGRAGGDRRVRELRPDLRVGGAHICAPRDRRCVRRRPSA
jgi:betaine-aldehyde dehydrogenase